MLRRILLSIVAASALSILGRSVPADADFFVWNNVAIGGGGCWVPGMAVSIPYWDSSKPVMYIRTDCGGAYRRTKTGWTPITDWLPFEHRSDYSIESIAVNPHAGNEVYIACGGYHPDAGRDAGTIYRSLDYGAHWKQAFFKSAPYKRFDGTTGLAMEGNGVRRWGGERLACDPGVRGRLLFGSRDDGLWGSSDDARTWSRIASAPVGRADYGITSVAFDPRANGIVYAAIEGIGVFRSSDHGASWKVVSAVPSRIATVRRMVVSRDGNVWLTFGANTGDSNPDPSKHGGIAEYIPKSGTCKIYDPAPGGASYYTALTVNPYNPKEIVAAVSTSVAIEQIGSSLWHTTDEGATWHLVVPVMDSSLPWCPGGNWTISDCRFDQTGVFGPPGSLWFTDGTGIWHSNGPIANGRTAFHSVETGHEELCVSCLCAPPSGPNKLIVGVLDRDGFPVSSMTTVPVHTLSTTTTGPWSAETLAVAYQDDNPLDMARLYSQQDFGGRIHLATSFDGGNTWQFDGTGTTDHWTDYLPDSITIDGTPYDFSAVTAAIDAKDPDNIVIMGNCRVDGKDSLAAVYSTRDLGLKEWNVSGGLFANGATSYCSVGESNNVLVADPEAQGVFYAANGGYIYKSADAGRTFERLSSPTNAAIWGTQTLRVTPGRSGDLWYSAEADIGSWQNHLSPMPGWEGLYHSTDGGQTWTKLAHVTRCIAFTIGAKAPNGNWPLYYYGRNSSFGPTAAVDTIYESTDYGASWTNILNPAGPEMIGNYPMIMEASRQTYGRVFIGTSGRGVFYSRPPKR